MARTPDKELADRRRRQILDAAAACFRQHGFHRASMQEICAEAGISAGALYRYFPSKTDIIASIVEDQCTAMREQLFVASTPEGLAAALSKMSREAVQKCLSQSSLNSEVFAEIQRSPALADIFRLKDAENREALAGAFERVMPQLAAAGAAERMARIVFLALDGLMLRGAIAGERDFKAFLGDFEFLVRRMMGLGDLKDEAGSGQGGADVEALANALESAQ